jgi:hypothetical protein
MWGSKDPSRGFPVACFFILILLCAFFCLCPDWCILGIPDHLYGIAKLKSHIDISRESDMVEPGHALALLQSSFYQSNQLKG